MTSLERKQRQYVQREQLFLDTAAKLIAAEGILQLQIAPLAKACDYATGTLYKHFSSKEDLLVALSARNGGRKLALFQSINALKLGTRDKMLALTIAEQLNRKRHPSHAKLEQYIFTETVWENASLARRQLMLDNAKPLAALVTGIVQEAIANGDLPATHCDSLTLALAPWALCLGTNALEQTAGLLAAFGGNPDPLKRYRHMQLLFDGMQWQPLSHGSSSAQLAAKIRQLELMITPLFTQQATAD